MGTVTMPPGDEARSIFDDLGYDVAGDGTEFSAVRDWKEVRVTAVTDSVDTPDDGSYRCFVTWEEYADELAEHLRDATLPYEWAIMSVDEQGDYEVARAPPAE